MPTPSTKKRSYHTPNYISDRGTTHDAFGTVTIPGNFNTSTAISEDQMSLFLMNIDTTFSPYNINEVIQVSDGNGGTLVRTRYISRPSLACGGGAEFNPRKLTFITQSRVDRSKGEFSIICPNPNGIKAFARKAVAYYREYIDTGNIYPIVCINLIGEYWEDLYREMVASVPSKTEVIPGILNHSSARPGLRSNKNFKYADVQTYQSEVEANLVVKDAAGNPLTEIAQAAFDAWLTDGFRYIRDIALFNVTEVSAANGDTYDFGFPVQISRTYSKIPIRFKMDSDLPQSYGAPPTQFMRQIWGKEAPNHELDNSPWFNVNSANLGVLSPDAVVASKPNLQEVSGGCVDLYGFPYGCGGTPYTSRKYTVLWLAQDERKQVKSVSLEIPVSSGLPENICKCGVDLAGNPATYCLRYEGTGYLGLHTILGIGLNSCSVDMPASPLKATSAKDVGTLAPIVPSGSAVAASTAKAVARPANRAKQLATSAESGGQMTIQFE